MTNEPEKRKLILASRSPRRRQLLAEAGYQFEVVEPGAKVECGMCSRESPAELVARLAFEKAADVARRVGADWCWGATPWRRWTARYWESRMARRWRGGCW